jgi:hypothetical protein
MVGAEAQGSAAGEARKKERAATGVWGDRRRLRGRF